MAPNPLHPEEYVLGGALRNILTECMLVDVREAPEGSLCPAATCALKPTAVLGGVTGYDSPEYTACPHRAPRTVQRTVHGAGPGALKTSAPLLRLASSSPSLAAVLDANARRDGRHGVSSPPTKVKTGRGRVTGRGSDVNEDEDGDDDSVFDAQRPIPRARPPTHPRPVAIRSAMHGAVHLPQRG